MGLITEKLLLIGHNGRTEVTALFDTGSTHSLVREDIARGIADLDDLPEPKEYQLAVGSIVARKGVFADVVLQGKRLTIGLKVVKGLTEELILGVDFMQTWQIRLDPRRHRATVDPRALRLKAVGSRHFPK